jgi:hypothetical protein
MCFHYNRSCRGLSIGHSLSFWRSVQVCHWSSSLFMRHCPCVCTFAACCCFALLIHVSLVNKIKLKTSKVKRRVFWVRSISRLVPLRFACLSSPSKPASPAPCYPIGLFQKRRWVWWHRGAVPCGHVLTAAVECWRQLQAGTSRSAQFVACSGDRPGHLLRARPHWPRRPAKGLLLAQRF